MHFEIDYSEQITDPSSKFVQFTMLDSKNMFNKNDEIFVMLSLTLNRQGKVLSVQVFYL